MRGIRTAVAEVVEDMQANGEAIPEALASRHFSGKFMVRVPPEVHRQLAVEAAEAGVSLNRLASAKLTQSMAPQARAASKIVPSSAGVPLAPAAGLYGERGRVG